MQWCQQNNLLGWEIRFQIIHQSVYTSTECVCICTHFAVSFFGFLPVRHRSIAFYFFKPFTDRNSCIEIVGAGKNNNGVCFLSVFLQKQLCLL